LYTLNFAVLTHFNSTYPISCLPQTGKIVPMLPARYKLFSRPTVQAVKRQNENL